MKRSKTIVAVTMIMMLSLLITGCGCSLFGKKVSKEDAAIMVGMWDLSNVTIDGKQTTAKELGISMSFEFYDDGTTKYTYNGKSEVYDWKKKADAIIIYVPDKTDSSKKEERTAIVNGDSTNTTNNTTQNKDSADRALLIGTWNVISFSTGGKTYSGDDIYGYASFEFKEDGTVIMHGQEDLSGIWELSNGNVSLVINYPNGTMTLSGTLEGTILTIDGTDSYDGSSGTIIMSKQ